MLSCLFPGGLGSRELRPETIDAKALNLVLLEEKVLDLARQVGGLLLGQEYLVRGRGRGGVNRWAWQIKLRLVCLVSSFFCETLATVLFYVEQTFSCGM